MVFLNSCGFRRYLNYFDAFLMILERRCNLNPVLWLLFYTYKMILYVVFLTI